MGQLQRDDRRKAQQETVELWEIERKTTRSSRPGQTGQSQQRRPGQDSRGRQEGRPRGERESQQRRRSWQEGQSRGERGLQQIEFSREEDRIRQRRVSQQPGKSRQAREAGQMRRPRSEYSQQAGLSRRSRRSEYGRPAPYRQEIELQLVSPAGYRQSGNPRPVQSIRRRRARRRKILLSRAAAFVFIALCLVLIYQTAGAVHRFINRDTAGEVSQKDKGIISVLSDKAGSRKITPPEIVEDYLEINDYSRPGTKLKKVKSIFVHYTANPGTSARNNRSYFANLAETHERAASAHLIIGYEGELIQCIPLNEQAFGVKGRNGDSLSIECCYLEEDGSFTPETYETLLHTLAWLLDEYDLTTEDILRHYDCGGKKCPLYYVEHEDAWEKLLADVEAYAVQAESK